MTGPIPLTALDLALAALFLVVHGAVSLAFRLGLARSMLVAAARMIAQLLAVAFVLRWIFTEASPAGTAALALVMVAVAGWEVIARVEQRLPRPSALALSTGTMLLVGVLATVLCVAGIVGADPWHAPRYLLPILGMVLGNAMTAAALVLETLTSAAAREQAAIEARLALGMDRLAAFRPVLARSLRTGLMPIVNTMAAAGIVALPGMMTGQILAGIDPVEAARYQIVILLVLAGATGLAGTLAGLGGVLLLTDHRHRLWLETTPPPGRGR